MENIDYEEILNSDGHLELARHPFKIKIENVMKDAVAAAVPIILKHVAENANVGVINEDHYFVDKQSILELESEIITKLTK